MEIETIYENPEDCYIKYTRGPGAQSDCQDEAQTRSKPLNLNVKQK